MKTAAVLFAPVVLGLASAALASEPGQPFDCSDWVILKPGISCSVYTPWRNPIVEGDDWSWIGGSLVWKSADNEGGLLWMEKSCGPQYGACYWQGQIAAYRCQSTLMRTTGPQKELIAYLDDRCGSRTDVQGFAERINLLGHVFDDKGGRLLVGLQNGCAIAAATDADCGWCPTYCGSQTIAFDGFATTFDVLQTYQPQQQSFGFRVPYMPDGFRAADHFDAYWGAVTRPLDLSSAQPLQCSYPDAPPHVGDYLSIAAPVPTPAPGHANYVLTAVTYQGQTRAGRQAVDGTLHGRDASVLPECEVAKGTER